MAIKHKEKPTTLLGSSYQKFWQGFNEASQRDERFCMNFKSHPYGSIRSYQDYAIGEPFHIAVGINFARHEIRVGAYFSNVDIYKFFFEENKTQIEAHTGRMLTWKLHKTKGSAYLYDTADFDESHGWNKAYNVMIEDMLIMGKAFCNVPPKPIIYYKR